MSRVASTTVGKRCLTIISRESMKVVILRSHPEINQSKHRMAIVEDVTEVNESAGPGPNSNAELLSTLRGLSKRLALPKDLLPSFMNEDKRRSGQSGGRSELRTWRYTSCRSSRAVS